MSAETYDAIQAFLNTTQIGIGVTLEAALEWFAKMPHKLKVAVVTRDSEARDEMLLAWYRDAITDRAKSIVIDEHEDLQQRVELIKDIANEVQIALGARKRDLKEKIDKKKRG